VSAEEPIRGVLVAGGGIVGWSAAAALKRRLPQLSVAVIGDGAPTDAPAELVAPTLPSIMGFHEDLGLREADTVARAGSALRLGTRFEGWAKGRPPYVHAYGAYGQPLGATSFHHLWLRQAAAGRARPFDLYSPSAALAQAGRVPVPAGGADGSAQPEYGLTLNLARYREMMRAFALHLGATERPGSIGEVRLDPGTGFIAGLALTDGTEARADLYVDCSGPSARLRSALGGGFADWGRWLPSDRLLLGQSAPPSELPLLDRVEALKGGWRWRSASQRSAAHGVAYASGWMTDEEALEALSQSGAEADSAALPLRQGQWLEPWSGNCVAVGDSAVCVEPLEWTNLHLAHSAIDRIVSMMPGRDCAPVELAEYNRQSRTEGERVRDFIALHYVAAERPGEPFWEAAAAAEPPPSLAHTLALYRERGRLPFHEEETFSRDSWLAVLIGQGVVPRRLDPLVDALSEARAEQALELHEASVAAAATGLPTHKDYLQALTRPARP
jgi:tryptophan halogenase